MLKHPLGCLTISSWQTVQRDYTLPMKCKSLDTYWAVNLALYIYIHMNLASQHGKRHFEHELYGSNSGVFVLWSPNHCKFLGMQLKFHSVGLGFHVKETWPENSGFAVAPFIIYQINLGRHFGETVPPQNAHFSAGSSSERAVFCWHALALNI